MHPCLIPNGIQRKRISGSTAFGAHYSDFYLYCLQTCNLLCLSVNICGVFYYVTTSKNKYQTPQNYCVLQLVGPDELMVSCTQSFFYIKIYIIHCCRTDIYSLHAQVFFWFGVFGDLGVVFLVFFESNNCYTWLLQHNSILTHPDTSSLPSGTIVAVYCMPIMISAKNVFCKKPQSLQSLAELTHPASACQHKYSQVFEQRERTIYCSRWSLQ